MFNITLNMEALLTLDVKNQHAVTPFKRDTFTLYENELMFGTSVDEAVKRVFQVGSSVLHTSKFVLQTANVTCSFVASHQNTIANITGDNQKRAS